MLEINVLICHDTGTHLNVWVVFVMTAIILMYDFILCTFIIIFGVGILLSNSMGAADSKWNLHNYLAGKKLQIEHSPHSTDTENSGLLMSFCHKKWYQLLVQVK